MSSQTALKAGLEVLELAKQALVDGCHPHRCIEQTAAGTKMSIQGDASLNLW